MAGNFKINKNTNFSGFGGFGADNYDLHNQFKGKPVSSKHDGLPDFSLQGNWSGGENNTWSNSEVSFDMMGKDKRPNNNAKFIKSSLKHPGVTITGGSADQSKGIMLSVDGVDRWMNKDTLIKGTNTMLGMSAQVGQEHKGEISYLDNGEIDWLNPANDHVVQGKNYANPTYARAKAQAAVNKKRKDVSTKTQFDLFEMTGGLIGVEKPVDNKGITPSTVPSTPYTTNPDGSYTTNRPDGLSYGVVKKSKSQQRRARIKGQTDKFQQSPLRQQADEIQVGLGREKVSIGWRRQGYGNRYVPGDWGKESTNIVTDYYTKSGLVGWAQGINPEHAQVNPDLEMEIITDTKKEHMVTPYATRSGQSNRHWIKETHTYKTVNRKDTMNKGDTMDWIHEKVMDKSKSNKKKYSKYYTPDPEVDEYQYYSVSDNDFASYKDYKQNIISAIDDRRVNQQFIIDSMDSNTKTVDDKDRSANLIPTLESTYVNLDDKASVLKDEVGGYNWQKKISQDQFGTDTIQGDSHISHVLDSYGGEVRGGPYYSQDIGKLVKKSKSYEDSLESQIKQKQNKIDSIHVDKTDDLTDYYTNKTDKEYEIANKEYLSKSLTLTKEERAELEYQRRAQGMNGGQAARQYKTSTSRGRPSLKQKSQSSNQYTNKRTRGGRNNLGGLVI